jgi:hypothetical protein
MSPRQRSLVAQLLPDRQVLRQVVVRQLARE